MSDKVTDREVLNGGAFWNRTEAEMNRDLAPYEHEAGRLTKTDPTV